MSNVPYAGVVQHGDFLVLPLSSLVEGPHDLRTSFTVGGSQVFFFFWHVNRRDFSSVLLVV